jgi:hypothetical protein
VITEESINNAAAVASMEKVRFISEYHVVLRCGMLPGMLSLTKRFRLLVPVLEFSCKKLDQTPANRSRLSNNSAN